MSDKQTAQVGTLQTQLPAARRAGRALGASLFLAIATACASAGGAAGGGGAVAEITRVLELSTDAWNTGDLAGFLEPYLDSPTTTYVGSSGITRGKAAIEAAYRASYWRAGPPAQKLRFVGIEVRELGDGTALAVGRYQLYEGTSPPTAEGIFSLVMTRTPDGWRIIHDHSS